MIHSALDWLFGLLSVLLGLAVFSVIPVLNLLSLGYLLHSSARVAATGRLRDGFVGVRKASVIGRVLVGAWLVFLPVRFLSGLWQDAELISPGGSSSRLWHAGLVWLTVVAGIQVLWACLRGGQPWHFLWPAPLRFIRWAYTPGKFRSIRDSLAAYLLSLRLEFYFWLGARAFVGTLLWLLLPVGVLMLSLQGVPEKGGALVSFLGAVLLMGVAVYLPIVQTRFAVENRFSAMFELREVRQLFQRAPIAFWLALSTTFLFAIPLYLLKIELPPREIAWLPSLLFVLFILPARMLTGWALSRALRRENPCHGLVRWTSRLALVPVVTLYVVIVYLAQYISWDGTLSLFQQHAFLLPSAQ